MTNFHATLMLDINIVYVYRKVRNLAYSFLTKKPGIKAGLSETGGRASGVLHLSSSAGAYEYTAASGEGQGSTRGRISTTLG